MRVGYAGPFDTKGVYKGGISVVVNDAYSFYAQNKSLFSNELIPLNTCRTNRNASKQGKLTIENIYNTVRIARDFSKEIKNNRLECIYYNSSSGIPLFKDLLILYFLKNIHGVKTIAHIHYAELEKVFSRKPLIKKATIGLIKKLDGIVFLSEKTRTKAIEEGIVNGKCTVIDNFHDICISEDDIEGKYTKVISKECVDIIFLGSINERKGIFDLLDALTSIKFPFKLHICGEVNQEEAKEKLDELVNKIGSSGQVVQHGYVSGDVKKKLLLECDALVLPSYAEGFPLVLLEGIAAGCYIITTNVGGIPEHFNSQNGAVINPGNKEELIKAINALMDRDKVVKVMRYNYSFSKRFTIEKFVKKTDDFISAINGKDDNDAE